MACWSRGGSLGDSSNDAMCAPEIAKYVLTEGGYNIMAMGDVKNYIKPDSMLCWSQGRAGFRFYIVLLLCVWFHIILLMGDVSAPGNVLTQRTHGHTISQYWAVTLTLVSPGQMENQCQTGDALIYINIQHLSQICVREAFI